MAPTMDLALLLELMPECQLLKQISSASKLTMHDVTLLYQNWRLKKPYTTTRALIRYLKSYCSLRLSLVVGYGRSNLRKFVEKWESTLPQTRKSLSGNIYAYRTSEDPPRRGRWLDDSIILCVFTCAGHKIYWPHLRKALAKKLDVPQWKIRIQKDKEDDDDLSAELQHAQAVHKKYANRQCRT